MTMGIKIDGLRPSDMDATLEALDGRPSSNILTYEEVVQVYRDKLVKTGSMDAALLKVAWVAYNRGLAAAKS